MSETKRDSTSSSASEPLPVALAGFAYVALVLLAPRLLRDPDVYFHPVIGRWILAHGAVPTADTFSYTMAGAPWTAHEWLAEIVLAWVHRAGGWTLLVALTAATTALALYVLARDVARRVPARYVVVLVVLALMLVASHLNARPHALAAPCLVVFLAELTAAREGNRNPNFALLLLVVLWANLHGSVLLAAIFALAFGLEAVVESRDASARVGAARAWGVFLVLCLAAMCMTPLGTTTLTLAARMEADPQALAWIDEWRPPDLRTFHPLQLWLVAFVAGGLALGVRLPWMRFALLIGLAFFALRRERYGEILGLAAPLLVAPALRTALTARAQAVPSQGVVATPTNAARGRRTPRAVAWIVATAVVATTLLVHRLGLARPAREITPDAALAAVRDARVTGHVLNAYGFGGYLMSHGVPTFVDGRIDLYGSTFLGAYVAAVAGADRPTLERLLSEHAIAWTLLPPSAPAVRVLDDTRGWRRLHTDAVAVVHVREPLGGDPSAPP